MTESPFENDITIIWIAALSRRFTGGNVRPMQNGIAESLQPGKRGLLNDTLVVWGGEFGRTIYCQGQLTNKVYGRDHHPSCFTYWLAGGGVRDGMSYGETDEYSVNVIEKPVHVHDLQATILRQLGIDHERLTYRYQGRYFRLTDVHGKVVEDILVLGRSPLRSGLELATG